MKEIVSVVVVTYNSQKTIIETLESIRLQDYGSNNLDLVISDDCSTDQTVSVIQVWIDEYKLSFNSVNILASNENKGVSANCNQAWRTVTTRWVKSIGGDDLLRPNCISSYMQYIDNNGPCFAIFSRMEWFGYINKIVPEKYDLAFFDMRADQQYNYLKFKSFNLAPTSFLNTKVLSSLGYADERFRNIEDLPLWLKFTKNGYKLSFNPIITVDYRVADSISKNSQRYINNAFLSDLIAIDKMHPLGGLVGARQKLLKLDMLTLLHGKRLIRHLTNNKKGSLSRILDIIHFLLRPVYVFIKAKKIFINKFY